MDFNEIVGHAGAAGLADLAQAADLMEAYRRHIIDGLHEALDYKIGEALAEAMPEKIEALYRTFHHLLADDPNAGDETEGEYGTMLARANMDAGVRLIRWLHQGGSAFTDIVRAVMDGTIEKYETAEFPERDDFDSSDEEDADDFDFVDGRGADAFEFIDEDAEED